MATPLPSRTAANDKLIMSTPYNQLTQRQKDYADEYGLTLQAPTATAPAPTVAPTVTPVTDSTDGTARQNAYELLMRQFQNVGLFDDINSPDAKAFGQLINSYLLQGYDPNTISLMLQDSDVYKQRFSGNDLRRKNGLGVLSPSEYLATEAAYKQIFQTYGLPAGFYDNPAHLADLIGKNLAPSEVNDRVKAWSSYVNNSDPAKLAQLRAYYPELTQGDMLAHFLDPKVAKPLLDRATAATAVGYQAARQGLTAPGVHRAEGFADLGVTEDQARQAYGQIAEILPQEAVLGQRFGDSYGQTDAEDELLGGLASARRKRERLNQSEDALFTGSSAVGKGSLAPPPGTY